MNWLRKSIIRWLQGSPNKLMEAAVNIAPAVDATKFQPDATCSITMHKAINGTVLQFRNFVPDAKHVFDGSWRTELYVLKDGESVHDALATMLVHQKLK